jgi:hypothetical protein
MSEVGYIKPGEDWDEIEQTIAETVYFARHGHKKVPVCPLCGQTTDVLMEDGSCYECCYLSDPEHPRPTSSEVEGC